MEKVLTKDPRENQELYTTNQEGNIAINCCILKVWKDM